MDTGVVVILITTKYLVILAVKGQRVACGEKGSTQTYPFIESDPCGPIRNHKQTCQDAELAVKENQSVSYSYTCQYT